MKKVFLCVLTLVAAITLVGCTKENKLLPFVSELREDVYIGESNNYKLKAHYGFSETPIDRDGNAGAHTRKLTLMLLDRDGGDIKVNATLNLVDTPQTETFALNPITFLWSAQFNADVMEKQFSVTITENGVSEEITLTSELPENTLSYKSALDALCKSQPELINAYNTNGTFGGEICMRVLVRNEKPYWYVGLTDKNGRTRALLIDGFTSEVLAVKDIF